MNASITAAPPLDLLLIVDFKWLMAHEGHRVHVERLQQEPDYASRCLSLALQSKGSTLQAAARRLALVLGLDAALL